MFQPSWANERTMGQQPMKAQADAKRAEHVQADECDDDAGPTKEPRHKRQQCKNMNRCQSGGVDPRDAKRLACLGSRQFGWHSKPDNAAGTIGSCRAFGFTSDKHRHPNSVGAKAKADACQRTARWIVLRQASGHRDTPPEDVLDVAAGLLARGSTLLSGLPKADSLSDTNWTTTRRLQLRG